MPILPSWGGQPGRMGICIISQYLILCKNIFQLIWFFIVGSLSEMKTHFVHCLGKIQYKYLLQNMEKLRPILNLSTLLCCLIFDGEYYRLEEEYGN